jgi:excisionase family DNA binding protein
MIMNYLPIREAAKKLGVHYKTVEKYIQEGLPAVKTGDSKNSKLLIPVDAFDTWREMRDSKLSFERRLWVEYTLKYKLCRVLQSADVEYIIDDSSNLIHVKSRNVKYDIRIIFLTDSFKPVTHKGRRPLVLLMIDMNNKMGENLGIYRPTATILKVTPNNIDDILIIRDYESFEGIVSDQSKIINRRS